MKKIIMIKEMSDGNNNTGDTWLETKSFIPDTKLSEVLEWGKNSRGKLIMTEDHSDTVIW